MQIGLGACMREYVWYVSSVCWPWGSVGELVGLLGKVWVEVDLLNNPHKLFS